MIFCCGLDGVFRFLGGICSFVLFLQCHLFRSIGLFFSFFCVFTSSRTRWFQFQSQCIVFDLALDSFDLFSFFISEHDLLTWNSLGLLKPDQPCELDVEETGYVLSCMFHLDLMFQLFQPRDHRNFYFFLSSFCFGFCFVNLYYWVEPALVDFYLH